MFQRRVRDVFFYRANCDRTKAIIERTGPFTQAILWANTAADFRQGIGLMRQLSGFFKIAFTDQL